MCVIYYQSCLLSETHLCWQNLKNFLTGRKSWVPKIGRSNKGENNFIYYSIVSIVLFMLNLGKLGK